MTSSFGNTTNNDVSIFVVLKKGSNFYIHNTDTNNTIKNAIKAAYNNTKSTPFFADISMQNKNDETANYNVSNNKTYNDIFGKTPFGSFNGNTNFNEYDSDSAEDKSGSSNQTPQKTGVFDKMGNALKSVFDKNKKEKSNGPFDRPLNGGSSTPSHPKYKKRTTSQKRRKLNIKTLKLKS